MSRNHMGILLKCIFGFSSSGVPPEILHSNKVLCDRTLLAQGSHLEQHNSAAGCGILDKSAPTSPFSVWAAGRAEERY